jgi:C4-dicarboxylate-specific signal transduction histidine kinase
MSTELAQKNRNSALGTMANGMAHEINNPLAIIISATSLIERNLQEPEINKLKLLEHTGRIKNTVNRIAKLITSLRNFSSEENSDQTDTEAFLFELVEDVSSLMSESFRSNGIFFENATPAQILIRCRRTDLQQAIYNLIHNSIDAIRHQSFRWIKVESSLTDKSIQILVTDSGLGIPKEIADKMMIPFFTTKEVGQGTGLGLSLSKGLIEKHGGKLFLDKSSAHTCFIIELPKDLLILNKKAS